MKADLRYFSYSLIGIICFVVILYFMAGGLISYFEKNKTADSPALSIAPTSKPTLDDLRISIQANKKGDTTFVVQKYSRANNGYEEWKQWSNVKKFESRESAIKCLEEIESQRLAMVQRLAAEDSAAFRHVGEIPARNPK